MTEQMTAQGAGILVAGIVLFWITVGALVGIHRARKARSLRAQRRVS